jgi:hypothetical protein
MPYVLRPVMSSIVCFSFLHVQAVGVPQWFNEGAGAVANHQKNSQALIEWVELVCLSLCPVLSKLKRVMQGVLLRGGLVGAT